MASARVSVSVKSLNRNPGRRNRRFVFKTLRERIAETEIDVFHNLDHVKVEPSSSSFFLDCLTQWRELNTAEDFISFYEETVPLAQTLPLLLLHKELIISKLISRLRIEARLSLEPILRLIAEIARDLLEDFIPFLPRITSSFLDLLKNGADKEPEIIEQIFTSWSYLVMYLQKYLTQDIVSVLRCTMKLRYYPKDFVQELMAEAMSFLLRNAPIEQVKKGIRKVILEVARKPSSHRKYGVSAILWHTMQGTASKLHSRGEKVLQMIMDCSLFVTRQEYNEGMNTITEVMISTFQRLCTDLSPEELKLVWNCLYCEINNCLAGESLPYLSCLLPVVTSIVSIEHGQKVSDYNTLLAHIRLLVDTFITTPKDGLAEDQLSETVSELLKLMLSVLDGLHSSCDMAAISTAASQWAPVFELRTPSLLLFLKSLVQKDPGILSPFGSYILSACRNLIKTSEEASVYLILNFSETLQLKEEDFTSLGEEVVLEIAHFLQGEISRWINKLNELLGNGDLHNTQLDETKLPLLWGIIRCYPLFVKPQENAYVLMNLVDAVDQLLMAKPGVSQQLWQCLMGAALSSYHKLIDVDKNGFAHTSRVLGLAKGYRSSPHILCSVADFLDLMYGSTFQATAKCSAKHPDLEATRLKETLDIFVDNLLNGDKGLRISTLRILCHYEPPADGSLTSQHPERHRGAEISETDQADISCNVLQLLLSIEETPVSVQTSRKLTLFVSGIQTRLSGMRVFEVYIPAILTGLIGILFNHFRDLSASALECLAVLLEKYYPLVWHRFVLIFEQFLHHFLKTSDEDADEIMDSPIEMEDIAELFHSFANTSSDSRYTASILPLLLQALQKIPSVAEARSRQIIPLLLRFLGYNVDIPHGVGSFDSLVCKVKDWKTVLIEWLSLLQILRNPRSLYCSQFLKEILVNRFLDDSDVTVQMKVLDCLLNWKDDFLLPYSTHLKNLVSSKTLREELTTWNLSESDQIENEHRRELVPHVIRLLMPKIRNLKTLASRKHASMSGRRAILGYISRFDVGDLPLFYTLLIKPLVVMEHGTEAAVKWFWNTLEITLDQFQSIDFFSFFTREKIMVLPWKKRYGFLHVVEDILRVFDEFHVRPFLDLLSGCVVRILQCCYMDLCDFSRNHSMDTRPANERDDETSSAKQFKSLRSLCLKIISFVLNKYEDHNFGTGFWDLFFESVKPLIDGFKQEGSSSEKPSSLFSCFLAMSQSQNLVSLLCRERNLIPDIISIISVPSASEAVITCVLKLIENLFQLDAAVESENNDIKDVLLPNLEVLINNLHCLFHRNNGKRAFVKRPGEIVLRVLKLLSIYVKDPMAAKKFVDMLLPLLHGVSQNSDVCTEALHILREVVPVLGCEATGMILNRVAPLLVVAELDMRLSVCDLLLSLAQKDTALISTAELVSQLNATSAMETSELDFDVVISAYEKISVEFFFGIRMEHTSIILSHCVHDMSSDELMLRHSAYRALLSFIEFSALVVGREMAGHELSEQKMEVDGSCWDGASVRRTIDKFLLKYMGDALNRGLSFRREWIDLLREMVLKLPEFPHLKTLKALSSDDAEVDFFNNIAHLQMHRRARALMRFRDVARSGELSGAITKRVFVPFFFSMLFDIKDKDEHLRRTCLDALASISRQMDWKSYYGLLMRCFRDLTRRPERRKVLIRLISALLNEFCFVDGATDGATDDAKDPADPNGMEIELAVPAECTGSVTCSEVQTCLLNTVLPKLQKLLSESDKVNIDVSLTLLKVLKLLPSDIMESHLPSIIQRISNFLKNRLESVRDEARSAMAECLKELGADYLPLIIRSMKATLKRGFELHVLGYTLYFVLLKGLRHSTGGELDNCLNDILSVIGNDIMGDVGDQKEVDKISSKMKETRKRMSYQTIEIVAENVTFKNNSLKLLSPVMSHLQKHLTPKMRVKLDKMLKHIAAGIERNASADQTDFFIFIYGLIDDALGQESRLSGGTQVATVEKRHNAGKLKMNADVAPQGWQLVTMFALQLFHNRLRSSKLDKKDSEVLSMLDPFVNLLATCLNSKYEEILSASLQCISHLIRLPLPSVAIVADKIKTTLLQIAQSSSNPKGPVMEACLRLLTELLKGTKVTLSRDQLHVLIHFPVFADLERNPSFVVLSLLKAIVRRKLVVPEIYDLASEVSKMMITSQMEPIRKRCSQIFLQFLLNYQLNQKRMDQHIDFLINSLRYEHASGREAVLEMLKVIMERFPQRVVNEWSMPLFLNLVNSLVHDPDNQIRSLIAADIQLLLRSVSSSSLDKILESSLAWYLGENKQLWGVAAQVLGLIVEVMKKGFHKHINNVLLLPAKDGKNRMKSILQLAVENDQNLEHSDEAIANQWKEAYYSLVLLQKILIQFPELFFEKHVEDIWKAISDLLMYPHLWIRGISSRLVTLYFKQISLEGRLLGTTYLTKTDKLFRVAVSQCSQLKGQLSDDASREVLKSNLVFTLHGIHAARTEKESRDPCAFWSALNPHEQGCFLEAAQLLDSSNKRIIIASLTSPTDNQINPENMDLYQLLVFSLLETLGKIALQSEDIQAKIVLSSFQLFATRIGKEDCQLYATQLLLPLYRICEGFSGKVISDDMKQYADEVRHSVQEIMGTKSFVQAYSHIRNTVKLRRDVKKQKEKVMAVVDPVRNAKRKLRAAAKHRTNKKRKITAMKMGRWMRR